MLDWNDLRYFLAVADAGSTLTAGRALRVSQTTVARRIAALEQVLELTLFDRQQSGYVLTPQGKALLESAQAVRGAANHFANTAAAQSRDISGAVRISTLEIYAVTLLPDILRDLRAAYPSIAIEVDASDEPRDLAAGAADIALRHSRNGAPDGGGLVGRRIASNPWSIYCSRAYADTHGVPATRRDLARHPFIGGGGPYVWPHYQAWLDRHGLGSAVAMHHGSPTGLLSAIRAGMGLAVLPCFVADRDPDLIRCLPPGRADPSAIWLITHERLRHVPRIRAVLDFLAARLKAKQEARTDTMG